MRSLHPSSSILPAFARARGAALLIVMVVVAVAAVLGFAMVSASTLQSQTAGNLQYVTAAEYLAESGAQLALRYLQTPADSPVAMPAGYYPGQTGVTFGDAVKGSADITVTYNAGTKLYTITSVGKADTSAGTTINKTLTATAAVVQHFKQTAAITTSSNIRIPASGSILRGVHTNGQLNAVGSITGISRGRSKIGSGSVATFQTIPASETIRVPSLATIKDYTGQYTYNGQTYTAQKLSTDRLSNVTLPTASDAATNPAGIYWYDGSVLLNGNVAINGTLYLTRGSLYAAKTSNTITPQAGFPAAVIPANLAMVPEGRLTANGLVWAGGGIVTYTSGAADPNASSGLLNVVGDLLGSILGLLGGPAPNPGPLAINGAYLAAGSAPIELAYKGTLTVSYDAAKVAVPDFSTTNAVNVGVRVVTWSMN